MSAPCGYQESKWQASVFAKGFNLRESYGSINRPDKQGTAPTMNNKTQLATVCYSERSRGISPSEKKYLVLISG
jgi:hypothetical protein